ncbi:uncharacterized protein PHALS_09298 [Plasmopara halstedii]|uniref:Uncharacterized protein n=1 Tax=Plasmopara halstedii TaxID=4781 RepID=A0A0P1AE19_PLAHL|nr:uncharacterized protein PHALS_09298 [Plasmopara halstedii]CEG39245.1 hypothetical protein PHALS_09298 [Plasmopara halstedii]|eukprot:XP_024575614.1 hypothetical protein PHALS_09298 [Plasmopara halstedii]
MDDIAAEFNAFKSMEVSFELKDVIADKKYGVRRQIITANMKRPDTVKTSVESTFIIENHHTKVKMASKPLQVMEVTESINDENTALIITLPGRLVEADKKID